MYILSQIFVCISTVSLSLSYFADVKKKVMLYCILYCIFYGTHYLLLGAFTGMIMTSISGIRNIWFYVLAKRGKESNIFTLILFVSISLVSGFLSYQDLYSLVSISANVISTYSVWQSDVKKYRYLSIIVSLCFILYAVHIGSLFAVILEIILLNIEIISLFKKDFK